MRRSTVANWFTRIHRHTSFRRSSRGVIHGDSAPAWEDLRLEACTRSEGQVLDLRLAYRGLSTGRCLVAREGLYLVEPTGPEWARELLAEAVKEWCASEADMD